MCRDVLLFPLSQFSEINNNIEGPVEADLRQFGDVMRIAEGWDDDEADIPPAVRKTGSKGTG